MIELLTDQAEATRGYRQWVDAMLAGSTATRLGWTVDGTAVCFGNYGHAEPGSIGDQVMLGVDPEFGSGTAKIVRPVVSGGAKRKLTLIGRDEDGRLKLLREGRLTKNSRSRLVIGEEFSRFSGLTEVPVSVAGERSDRHWYVVADLDAASAHIVTQTVAFANACARARARAGGGKARRASSAAGYGMDEKGGVTTVTRKGGTVEVVRLQGYVFEQLKKEVGPRLKKPKDAYCVDGMIKQANLLLEIKTGTSPRDLYEAVGQLQLYPPLIGLPDGLTKALLVPDEPPIGPSMAAALEHADVDVYTYSISKGRKAPRITFTQALLDRCRQTRPSTG